MDKNFNRFCGPSSLWTAFYRVGDPSSLWQLHHLLKMSSSLWTYFTVMVTRPLRGQAFFSRDDPSTLWRLYRPVYGLVKYFHRLGGPSTLWTVLLTRWWSVHFVAVTPSNLRTCKIFSPFRWSVHLVDSSYTVVVVRPLCGGYTVQFMDLRNIFTILVVRPLCGHVLCNISTSIKN